MESKDTVPALIFSNLRAILSHPHSFPVQLLICISCTIW